jgi:hypothetical protein
LKPINKSGVTTELPYAMYKKFYSNTKYSPWQMLKKPEGFNMNNRRCNQWMDTTHTSTPTGLNAYVKMELFITNTMIMIAMEFKKKNLSY